MILLDQSKYEVENDAVHLPRRVIFSKNYRTWKPTNLPDQKGFIKNYVETDGIYDRYTLISHFDFANDRGLVVQMDDGMSLPAREFAGYVSGLYEIIPEDESNILSPPDYILLLRDTPSRNGYVEMLDRVKDPIGWQNQKRLSSFPLVSHVRNIHVSKIKSFKFF